VLEQGAELQICLLIWARLELAPYCGRYEVSRVGVREHAQEFAHPLGVAGAHRHAYEVVKERDGVVGVQEPQDEQGSGLLVSVQLSSQPFPCRRVVRFQVADRAKQRAERGSSSLP
jgi:hypothetical protein